MSEEAPKSLKEIALERAQEKAPERASEETTLRDMLERKRQLEMVRDSIAPVQDQGPAIMRESQDAIDVARQQVRSEIAGLGDALRDAGSSPDAFTREVFEATEGNKDAFDASPFATDPSAKSLHEKVRALRDVAQAQETAEPALRAKLESLGITGDAFDAEIEKIKGGSMRPELLNPRQVVLDAARKTIYPELDAIERSIQELAAKSPQFKEIVEESRTSPYQREVEASLKPLQAQAEPLREQSSNLYGEEASLKYYEEDLEKAEKNLGWALQGAYAEIFKDVGATFYSNGKEAFLTIDTQGAIEALNRKTLAKERLLSSLRSEQAEISRKKAGGFLQMKQSEKDDRLEDIERRIERAEVRLPSVRDIEEHARLTVQQMNAAFSAPKFDAIRAPFRNAAKMPLGELISLLRASLENARTEANFQEKRAAMEDKRTSIKDQLDPLGEQIAPLAQAQYVLERNKNQRP